MKNIYKVFFLLLLLSSFSKTSFAQYPFYGFELSNYEIGDTLEYSGNNFYPSYGYVFSTSLYSIINKEFLSGNDSIKYTMRVITYGLYNTSWGSQIFNKSDTTQSVINNDTIFNNDNNILHISLNQYDTMGPKVNSDSFYQIYDTINNLKRVISVVKTPFMALGFEAVENIGLLSFYNSSDDINSPNIDEELIYAHLSHYGIFGTYQYISDGVNKNDLPQTNISIRYDNGGNALLLYSSNENIMQPMLAVYDLLGRKVGTQPVSIGSNLVNTNNLAAGMYLYKVMSNENAIGQGKFMNMKN